MPNITKTDMLQKFQASDNFINSLNHYDMVLENTIKFNKAAVIGMQNQLNLKN
jgi:hypothetical protein